MEISFFSSCHPTTDDSVIDLICFDSILSTGNFEAAVALDPVGYRNIRGEAKLCCQTSTHLPTTAAVTGWKRF